MDYATNLNKIINDFQASMDFHILKNNYSNDSIARNYLEEYSRIMNDPNLSVEDKYNQIQQLLQKSNSIAINVVGNIDKISNLWKPNTGDINKISQFEYRKCLTILEQIKNTFENSSTRNNLSNKELYSLYVSYYQLSNLFNNNQITNEVLSIYEDRLYPIYHQFWERNSTNPETFKSGDDFKFIIHATTSSKRIDKFKRGDSVSCSYITQNEMGHFNGYGYIIDIDGQDDIISICPNDMGTSENGNERFIGNPRSTKLMTPNQLEQKCILQNTNGIYGPQQYNEIYKKKFNPKGIFCFTFGEKELSDDYVSAKKLAKQTGLPFVEIDMALYRTKNNSGSILTDNEGMTREEQSKFAENFLMKYYQSKHNTFDIFEIQKFVGADLNLYQDMIIDIFLEQKRNGNVDISNLFRIYEESRKKRKDKSEDYNTYINEITDLKEVVINLGKALENCDNDEIKQNIISELDNIKRRIGALNVLIENTNSIGLSSNNWIYQTNPLINNIMKDYSPFLKEIIQVNGEDLELIIGYKSKEQIGQDKKEMLSLLETSKDPMSKRVEHAKRVIEVRCAGYETNSINNKLATYRKVNPDLEEMKDNSSTYVDIVSMDKTLSKYDSLKQDMLQKQQQLKYLEDGKRIIDGASIYDYISKELSEWDTKLTEYQNQITTQEQKLASLRQQLQVLEESKKQYLSKNFIGKFLSRNKLSIVNSQIESINDMISMSEQNISSSRSMIETITQHKKESTDFFLRNYGLDGMDMQQYKDALEQITSYKEDFADVNKPIDLKSQIQSIEQTLSEINMTPEQEQQLRMALNQKKMQVGLIQPQQIIQENIEVMETLQENAEIGKSK